MKVKGKKMCDTLRRYYITLCLYNDTEVTVQQKNDCLIVTFEQAVNDGFKSLDVDIQGSVICNKGFSNSEVSMFIDFVKRNASEMIKLSQGYYDL